MRKITKIKREKAHQDTTLKKVQNITKGQKYF
jgi:hypothetical protein